MLNSLKQITVMVCGLKLDRAYYWKDFSVRFERREFFFLGRGGLEAGVWGLYSYPIAHAGGGKS